MALQATELDEDAHTACSRAARIRATTVREWTWPGIPRDHVQRYLISDGTRDRLNRSIMARLKAGISSGLRLDTRFPSTTAS